MKKKILNNWGLKLISVVIAIVAWAVILNINDPVRTLHFSNMEVEILNGDILTEQNYYWAPVGGEPVTVDVFVEARLSSHRNIRRSDFKLTADMNDYWPGNGSIKINTRVLNNTNIIDSFSLSRSTIQITTETLQTKQFEVSVETLGNPPEGYSVGDKVVTPKFLIVTGPQSIIGRIDHVSVAVDVNGATENLGDVAVPILNDANGDSLDLADKLEFSQNELAYSVEILKEREAQLNFNVVGQVASGYRYVGIEASQNSVRLTGPPDLVASVGGNITVEDAALNLDGATGNITAVIDLNKYLPAGVAITNLEGTEITVVLRVEQLRQKTFLIAQEQIELRNQAEGLDYDFAAAAGTSITIIVEGRESELAVLELAGLGVFADVRGRTPGFVEVPLSFGLDERFRVLNAPVLSLNIQAEGEAPEESTAQPTTSTTPSTTAPESSTADESTTESNTLETTADPTIESQE